MHIDLTPHLKLFPKCSKMTEDRPKDGMNGIIDSGGSGNVGAHHQGGRLKFFKDGKFILELARAREGERVSWVSVPRKTFWPPPAPAAGNTPLRQESSTSLSVSDDNSSIQSSPWQRDHTWKQQTPRCNVSSEMTFFYLRPRPRGGAVKIPILRFKRRRPFDKCDNVQLNRIRPPVRQRSRPSRLTDIVKQLWDKKPQFKSILSIRPDQIVSPRKRILRELERVTIDDLSVNKRSKAKPSVDRPVHHQNGTTKSFSITSLLSHDSSSSPNVPSPEHYRYLSPPQVIHKSPQYYSPRLTPRSSPSSYISPYFYSSNNPSPYSSYYGSYRYPSPMGEQSSSAASYGNHPVWTHVSPNSTLRDDIPSDVPLNLSKNGG